MAAQKTARASPELRKGSTQPALPSVLHHHPGHKHPDQRKIGKTTDLGRNLVLGTKPLAALADFHRGHRFLPCVSYNATGRLFKMQGRVKRF